MVCLNKKGIIVMCTLPPPLIYQPCREEGPGDPMRVCKRRFQGAVLTEMPGTPIRAVLFFPSFFSSLPGLLIDLGTGVNLLFFFSFWVIFTDPWYVMEQILVQGPGVLGEPNCCNQQPLNLGGLVPLSALKVSGCRVRHAQPVRVLGSFYPMALHFSWVLEFFTGWKPMHGARARVWGNCLNDLWTCF